MSRMERRSVFLPNRLWDELLKVNYGICPVSEFIRRAIIEKLIRDDPKKEDYYKELIMIER